MDISILQRLRRNERLKRDFVENIARKSVLGYEAEINVGIIGMGAVGSAFFDAVVNVDKHDYSVSSSPVKSIKVMGRSGPNQKMAILKTQMNGFVETYGLEGKIEVLNERVENAVEKIVSKTDVIAITLGAPVITTAGYSKDPEENDMQHAVVEALRKIDDIRLDYRFKQLPSNLPLMKRWAKYIKGYEGHIMIFTNPTDIMAYAFAGFFGSTSQVSGFNHIDTWRTRNTLLREKIGDSLDDLDIDKSKVYALGDHGNGLVVVTSGTRFERYRPELQEKVRHYARNMKEGIGNDSWIRKELTPAAEEVLQAIGFNLGGVSMSAFDSSKGIYVGQPVEYKGRDVRVVNVILNDEEQAEYDISCSRLDEVVKLLIDSGVVPKVRDEVKEYAVPNVKIDCSVEQKGTKLLLETEGFNVSVLDVDSWNIQRESRMANITSLDCYGDSILAIVNGDTIEESSLVSGERRSLFKSDRDIMGCSLLGDFMYAAGGKDGEGYVLVWGYPSGESYRELYKGKGEFSDINVADIEGMRNSFLVQEDKVYRFRGGFDSPLVYRVSPPCDIYDIRIFPDSEMLFGRTLNAVHLWNLDDVTPRMSFKSTPGCYCFDICRGRVYVPNGDEVLGIDIRNARCVDNKKGFEKVIGVACSDNDLFVASGYEIHKFDIDSGEKLEELRFPRKIYSMMVV